MEGGIDRKNGKEKGKGKKRGEERVGVDEGKGKVLYSEEWELGKKMGGKWEKRVGEKECG